MNRIEPGHITYPCANCSRNIMPAEACMSSGDPDERIYICLDCMEDPKKGISESKVEIIKPGNPPKGKYVVACRSCGCVFAVDSTRLLRGCASPWMQMEGDSEKPPSHPCPQHGCGNTLVCMKLYNGK